MGDIMVEQNWAMILDSVVENVCIWDGDTSTWQPPSGYLMEVIPAGSSAGIGWGWDGTDFTPPPPVMDPALAQPGTAPDVEH